MGWDSIQTANDRAHSLDEGEEGEEEVGTGSTYTTRMSWDTLNVPQPTGQCGDLEADWAMRCLLL